MTDILVHQGKTQTALDTIAGEMTTVHSRISGVRQEVGELRIDLSKHVSYHKGARRTLKGLLLPVVSGTSAAIAAILLVFWNTIVNWVKGVLP